MNTVNKLLGQAVNETNEFGKAKCLQTFDGREVRIYCLTGGGLYPVHGAYFNCGEWSPLSWSRDGSTQYSGPLSLVPTLPKKHVGYVNVYPGTGICMASIYESRKQADFCADSSRVGCIRVEVEEGRFDP